MKRSSLLDALLTLSGVGQICWEWRGTLNDKGYGKYGHRGSAHRLSYIEFKGPIPDDLDVCHTCDNPKCINPLHLFLGTHIENMQDMKSKGRRASFVGEKNGVSKLTEKDVIYIRTSSKTGAELAEEFGVSRSNISSINKGHSWGHVFPSSKVKK